MAYNPSIPLATDLMLKSQAQIRSNFQSINTLFAQNHINLNLEFQGMHKLLSLRKQGADPTTTADQVSIYSKDVASVPQLFFRPNNSQAAIQLTYSSIKTGLQSEDPDVYFAQQQTFLAGPFVVHAGLLTNVAQGALVNLSPATTLIYVGLQVKQKLGISLSGANTSAAATNVAGSQFNVRYASNLMTGANLPDIYYLAIGL